MASRMTATANISTRDVIGANGRHYRLRLSWPFTPPPTNGWPLLAVLDGDAYFGLLTDATRNLAQIGEEIADCAVLGIGYAGTDPCAWHNLRALDLTPTGPGPDDLTGMVVDPSGFGGLDPFLDMLAGLALPWAGEQVTINPAQRALFGHSFGGLAALHARFTRLELFSRHIVISPALYWNNEFVCRSARVTGEPLYIGVGAREGELIDRNDDTPEFSETRARAVAHADLVGKAARLADQLAAGGETLRFDIIADETHVGAPYAALAPALRFIFQRTDSA
jgi:uncharacterized protein